MAKEKVLVGMSGGVDSSVAAVCLLEKGYDVTGCTLLLCGDVSAQIRDAKSVCDRLGIEHITLDLREEFENSVIADFIGTYYSGKTPNPCIVCNKTVKFGKMLEFALENGFQKIATGHYAEVTGEGDGLRLVRPKDRNKDQTYMLYSLSKYQLSKVLFPLGGMEKSEVREIAEKNGFVNANKPDSQDICFVPDGDYARFIEEYKGERYPAGDYIDVNGKVLGRHNGVIRYTIGQRKGLGIALGKPAFVIDKNHIDNTVTLDCDENLLFKKEVKVSNLNFLTFDIPNGEIEVFAKLRYRHIPAKAVLKMLSEETAVLEFSEPQRAPSAGQAAVFYDGDTVVGGGTII